MIQFKTRHSVIALNPAEVSDVMPCMTDEGMMTQVRMRNRIEHVVFETYTDVLDKLSKAETA